jgi:hypothetical protein
MSASRWMRCGVIVFAVSLGLARAPAADDAGLLKLVLDGVKDSESRLRNYRVTFRYERQWNAQARDKYLSKAERESLYPYQRTEDRSTVVWEMGKFSVREAVKYENNLVEHFVAAYDGRLQKTYRPEHQSGLVKAARQLPVIEGPYEFLNQSFRHVQNMSLSDYLQKSKIDKLTAVNTEGRQLFVLDVQDPAGSESAPIRTRITIDPACGYALRKAEFIRPDISEEPRIILEVEEFKEVIPGVYFPMQGRKDVFRGGRGEPVVKYSSCRTVVEEVAVNLDLPADTFQFEFPVGTEVYDEFLGTAYRTGTTQEHLDAIEKVVQRETTSSYGDVTDDATTEPNRLDGRGASESEHGDADPRDHGRGERLGGGVLSRASWSRRVLGLALVGLMAVGGLGIWAVARARNRSCSK